MLQPAFLIARSLMIQSLTALLLLCALPALANTYDAKLDEAIHTSPDLCHYAPCADVLPGASEFSVRKGHPPYVEAFGVENGARKLLGYVMLSTDITDTPAYSGKPVVTLIGMNTTGQFIGAKVLKHSEPILLLGIPESELTDFLAQYKNLLVTDNIEVSHAHRNGNNIGLDGISGATVTVIAQHQVMMTSAMAVAQQTGIIEPTIRPQANFISTGKILDWNTLVDEGSVQSLKVQPDEVGLPPGNQPFIELWFGYLNQPDVGRSILGDISYRNLMAQLKPGEHALFVVRTAGTESFKGSGFVRGGIYDRVQVRQGMDIFSFRDRDYLNLYGIEAAGAPAFNESAIYIIRSPSFSAAFPWQFNFLGNRVDRETGTRSFARFDSRYWIAGHYLQGGRPQVTERDAAWLKIWKSRWLPIVFFSLLLVAIATVYARRDYLTRRSTHRHKWPVNSFKYSAWIISIGFVGFGLLAQPSITQVLTWFHSILFKWEWQLFLSDPFIFLFWVFIIITVFLWGRGLFCGWLCPFGSLTELIYKAAGKLGLKRLQRKLPRPWHDRLKWIKYAAFFSLLAVSLFSMTLAEQLAEIEPFKTTFLVGVLNRSWPYGAFVALLLGISIFVERPFCKYLCPLGAALASLSTFRWFGLKRKQECNSCHACAKGCGSLAIDRHGRIDQRECLLCLDCMVLYTDDHACPPLAQERKRRQKHGLALTPINAEGYFTPCEAAPAVAPLRIPAREIHIDPRMPTDPVIPSYVEAGRMHALVVEIIEHLWPWARGRFSLSRTLLAIGAGVIAAAAMIGIQAFTGHLQTGIPMGLWTGWCLLEVIERMGSKPYVKEGPWWQRHYRVATTMDMISYVGFKNLLFAAVLFLLLKSAGLLALANG